MAPRIPAGRCPPAAACPRPRLAQPGAPPASSGPLLRLLALLTTAALLLVLAPGASAYCSGATLTYTTGTSSSVRCYQCESDCEAAGSNSCGSTASSTSCAYTSTYCTGSNKYACPLSYTTTSYTSTSGTSCYTTSTACQSSSSNSCSSTSTCSYSTSTCSSASYTGGYYCNRSSSSLSSLLLGTGTTIGIAIGCSVGGIILIVAVVLCIVRSRAARIANTAGVTTVGITNFMPTQVPPQQQQVRGGGSAESLCGHGVLRFSLV